MTDEIFTFSVFLLLTLFLQIIWLIPSSLPFFPEFEVIFNAYELPFSLGDIFSSAQNETETFIYFWKF